MHIRIVEKEEELLALECIWNELLFKSCSAHIHSTFEWLYTWWKHMGGEMKLFVLVAEEEGRVTAIAPLVIRRVGKLYNNIIKFRQLCFMGVGFSDHADFIIPDNREVTIRSFLKYIRDHEDKWDEVNLKQINNQSPNFPYFQNGAVTWTFLRRRFRRKVSIVIEAPYLELKGTFEEYSDNLPVRFRKQIDRATRNLEAKGKLGFRVASGPDENVLQEMLRINTERNKLTGRRSILLDDKKYAFIREVLPKLAEKGWLRIFGLWLDERLISYELAFSFNRVIYDWNTSYDLEYAKYSAGRILSYNIIKYGYEHGFIKYDLMVGYEEYKLKWTNTISNNYSLSIRKKNAMTEFVLIYDSLKNQLKDFQNVQ